MRNLYIVTATAKIATPPAPLRVVAATQKAAIRKAQKALYGPPAAVPYWFKWEAKMAAANILL